MTTTTLTINEKYTDIIEQVREAIDFATKASLGMLIGSWNCNSTFLKHAIEHRDAAAEALRLNDWRTFESEISAAKYKARLSIQG